MKTFIFAIVLALVFALPSAATVNAAVAWEVRTTGNDTNGGGYYAGGTDMSLFNNKNAAGCTSCQSSSANISVTDGVAAGTTTITSATANFTSAIVGNMVYVSGGTGSIAAARYQVMSRTSAIAIVVDRSAGLVAGTGVTINIGGALASPSQAFTTGMVASNTVWIKSGTYPTTAALAPVAGGATTTRTNVIGYTSTRGDSGTATIQLVSGTSNVFTVSNYTTLSNLVVDANSLSADAIASNGNQSVMKFLTVKNFTEYGVTGTQSIFLEYSRVTSGIAGCVAGVNIIPSYSVVIGSSIDGNACPGIIATASGAGTLISNSLIANNTGATSDGVYLDGTYTKILGCTFYANGRDGVRFNTNKQEGSVFLNNLFVDNVGFAVYSTSNAVNVLSDYNAVKSSGGVYNQWTIGAHDAILSVNPFTNAAGGDFSLNATAGGGAVAHQAGYPGVLPYGGIGYRDVGALQKNDISGGTSGGSCANVQ